MVNYFEDSNPYDKHNNYENVQCASSPSLLLFANYVTKETNLWNKIWKRGAIFKKMTQD